MQAKHEPLQNKMKSGSTLRGIYGPIKDDYTRIQNKNQHGVTRIVQSTTYSSSGKIRKTTMVWPCQETYG